MHERKAFSVIPKASPQRPNHVTICLLGSRCKMANSSSEDETDTLPERPTRIQPYQFEPARQDLSLPGRILKEYRYSMGFAKSHSLKCSLHKWA